MKIVEVLLLYGLDWYSRRLRHLFDHQRGGISGLWVFDNRIPRRIFGPKKNENGDWRRPHNEELRSLYRSPKIVWMIKSKRLSWARHVARLGEGRRACEILAGKPTEKRPIRSPWHRWEDNIRMDLKEIGVNTRNWVNSAHYCVY